ESHHRFPDNFYGFVAGARPLYYDAGREASVSGVPRFFGAMVFGVAAALRFPISCKGSLALRSKDGPIMHAVWGWYEAACTCRSFRLLDGVGSGESSPDIATPAGLHGHPDPGRRASAKERAGGPARSAPHQALQIDFSRTDDASTKRTRANSQITDGTV